MDLILKVLQEFLQSHQPFWMISSDQARWLDFKRATEINFLFMHKFKVSTEPADVLQFLDCGIYVCIERFATSFNSHLGDAL